MIMPFAQECFWAFQRRSNFWKIFEKFSLVPPFFFFQKMRVLNDLAKIPITWPFGNFWSSCLRKNVLPSLHFKCVLLRGKCHLRQCAFGPFKRGLIFGRFLKISLGPPFALFQKMRVLGDLAKIALTWPFGQFWSRFFDTKYSPVFAL